ncbi:hypothetical protein EGW08_001933 [Elysia chlorotica]|uniref:Uncharacterized protein n=1 Tax=Elysia chlorotica TaxID=188477 RepID=A0A3S1BWE0_ELYCH|nr:hypothetical protein EGW08_001933 [Elysia chlorotica]
MVPALFRVVCFCMATYFSALASESSLEADIKMHGVDDRNPASFSLWSALKRVLQSKFEPLDERMDEDFSNGNTLEQHDSNDQAACCSCGTDDAMAQREEEVRAAQLSRVTDILLDKMRFESDDLDKLSSVTKDNQMEITLPKLPPNLLDIDSENDVGQDVDEYYAWDKQTIEPGKYFSEDCPLFPAGGCFSFDLNDLQNYRDSIQGSILWLHTISGQMTLHQQHEVVVYQLFPKNM